MLYTWIVYLHIAGVLGFMLAHGVSVAVAFRIRRERAPASILALLELSSGSITLFYVSITVLLGAGIAAGFTPGAPGTWWGHGWIWTALVTFVLTMVAMWAVASPYYRRVRTIAEAMAGGSQVVTEERLAAVLGGPRPWILAVVGFGSIAFILYLMMFKPF